MKIDYLIFPIISLSIIYLGLVNATYGQSNGTSQIYEDRDIGIRFLYPSDWGKIVVPTSGCHKETTCILSSEGTNGTDITFRFALLAAHKETCDCSSLTEFVRNTYKSNEQAMKAFSFINDNQTTVGKKYPSWQYESSFLNADNANTKSLNVLTTNNETYFTIAIAYPIESQAKVLPQFKNVIDSIEFFPIQIPKKPSFMNASEMEQSKPSLMLENNPTALQILSHNSFTDSLGYFHIVGEVKNNSPSTATFVKIIGTFYDANNQVVGTESGYADPYDLVSGQTAPFEILLLSASIPISQIDRYTLQASD